MTKDLEMFKSLMEAMGYTIVDNPSEVRDYSIKKPRKIIKSQQKYFPRLESGQLVMTKDGKFGKISRNYEENVLYFYFKGESFKLSELMKAKNIVEEFVRVYNPKTEMAIHSYNPKYFSLIYSCLEEDFPKKKISLDDLLKEHGLTRDEVELV